MAVEGENQLVIGTGVTNNASDQGQLVPMIDGVAAGCGDAPDQVLADAGYDNEQDLRELGKRSVDAHVVLGSSMVVVRYGKSRPKRSKVTT